MRKNICGVLIDDLSKKEIMANIKNRLKRGEKTVIYTPNPVMAENGIKDGDFLKILNSSTYNIPDGQGIILASRLLKTPIKERISGIELGEEILKHAAKRKLRVFLLGGSEGIAREASRRLSEVYRGLTVSGTLNGFDELENATKKINESRADVVFVCLGSPKQERWIDKHKDDCSSSLFIGLGGSLDVWSGKVRRAPVFIRKIGLEWLWRMIISPSKIKNLPILIHFGARATARSTKNLVKLHIRNAKFHH